MSAAIRDAIGNEPEGPWTEQLARLADVIVAMCELRFDEVPAVPGTGPVAAVAAGLGALSEELQATVVAREEAEAAALAKSQFLANMSHELRTPLTTIVGSASLLDATELSPRQRRYVRRIHLAGAALERLVGDVLDFARIEAGSLRLEAEPTCLRSLFDGLVQAHEEPAQAKGLRLEQSPWVLPGDLVLVDSARLLQLVHNLLDNAVKYTHRGFVRVGVEHRLEGGRVALHVEVEDSGVGIPGDRLASVFDSFHQVDASMRREQAGLGLGLSIVAGLARAMGGTLDVRSDVAHGTCFQLDLALPLASGTTEPPLPAEPGLPSAAGRVLVVDDNLDLRELVGAMLERLGYPYVLAGSGFEALERLSEERFDLVLMDLQMPGLDGLETTRRALARWPELRVIAVTAHSREQDVAACFEAGMVGHLAKPFRLARFAELMGEELPVRAGTPRAG